MIFNLRNTLIAIAVSLSVGFAAGWQAHVVYTGYKESKRLKDAAKVAGETNRKEAAELNSNQETAYALDDAIRNSNTDDDDVFKCVWVSIREGRATARCVPKAVPLAAAANPPAKPVP